MRGRRWLGAIAVAAATVVGLAAEDRAGQTGGGQGPKAVVTIRLTHNFRDGRAPNGVAVGEDLAAGEVGRLFVTAGRAEPPELCDVSGASGTARADMERNSLFMWSFEVRMVEVAMGRISFDLWWDRMSKIGPPVRETMRLTLREGGTAPLDLIHGQPGSNCASVHLEASAAIVEDRALENKMIDWDIWWTPSVQSQPIQVRVSSRQGEEAAFEFEPQAVPIQQSGDTSVKVTQSVRVLGQIRGRVRPDGRIDVVLNTQRGVGMAFNSGGRGTSSRTQRNTSRVPPQAGGAGQKSFIVQADEAVRIVLPPIGPSRVTVTTREKGDGQRVSVQRLDPPVSAAGDPTTEMALVIRARVR